MAKMTKLFSPMIFSHRNHNLQISSPVNLHISNMTKGTTSFGKRHSKSHVTCRRCGKRSYHIQKKTCSSCGYPGAKMRRCKFPRPRLSFFFLLILNSILFIFIIVLSLTLHLLSFFSSLPQTPSTPKPWNDARTALAACVTWRPCHASSRTVSVRVLSPSPDLPKSKKEKIRIQFCCILLYLDICVVLVILNLGWRWFESVVCKMSGVCVWGGESGLNVTVSLTFKKWVAQVVCVWWVATFYSSWQSRVTFVQSWWWWWWIQLMMLLCGCWWAEFLCWLLFFSYLGNVCWSWMSMEGGGVRVFVRFVKKKWRFLSLFLCLIHFQVHGRYKRKETVEENFAATEHNVL